MSPQVLGAFALFPLPRSNKQQGLIAKTMGQGELANEANEQQTDFMPSHLLTTRKKKQRRNSTRRQIGLVTLRCVVLPLSSPPPL